MKRQPNWKYASNYLDYLSRIQMTLRQGTPKVDVAVYHHSYYETIDFWGPDKIFKTESLEQNGYSYDFLSPATINLDNMKVKDGILDKDGSGYKALVFDNQSDISYETANKILEFAKKGLKIIFVGEIPNNNVFSDDKDINSIMEKIIKQENVVCVDSVDDVVNALKEKNIVADANYNNQTLLSNHHKTKNNDYYFIYNYGGTNNYREVENVQNV